MLNFSILWDLAFKAFEIFIAVGIVWLLWIEKLFANQRTSVIVMIIVALLAAGLYFFRGIYLIRRDWNKAQKQLQEHDAAAIEYEGEIA